MYIPTVDTVIWYLLLSWTNNGTKWTRITSPKYGENRRCLWANTGWANPMVLILILNNSRWTKYFKLIFFLRVSNTVLFVFNFFKRCCRLEGLLRTVWNFVWDAWKCIRILICRSKTEKSRKIYIFSEYDPISINVTIGVDLFRIINLAR